MMTRVTLTVIFVLMVVAAFAHGQVATDGLVSYWSFDSATITGDTVKDLAGNNDGTIIGPVNIVTGRIGDCLEYDFTVSINCGHSGSLDLSLLTTEAWVKTDVQSRQEIMGNIKEVSDFSDTTGGYEIWTGGDTFIASWFDENTDIHWFDPPGAVITDGVWHHVVATWDENEARLYVDGALNATEEMPPPGPTDPGDFIIADHPLGVHQGKWLWIGLIDEMRVYDRPLGEAEINKNFLATVGPSSAVAPAGKLAFTWGEIKVSH